MGGERERVRSSLDLGPIEAALFYNDLETKKGFPNKSGIPYV